MCKFSLDPQVAKMLIFSPQFNRSMEILWIVIMVSAPNSFFRPTDAQQAADAAKACLFSHQCRSPSNALCLSCFQTKTERIPFGVINFLLTCVLRGLAGTICKSVSLHHGLPSTKTCSTHFNNQDYDINIWKALLAGYFMQVVHSGYNGWPYCKRQAIVHLHPSSCLNHNPEWILCSDLVHAEKKGIT